jgi:hypothetical protein
MIGKIGKKMMRKRKTGKQSKIQGSSLIMSWLPKAAKLTKRNTVSLL